MLKEYSLRMFFDANYRRLLFFCTKMVGDRLDAEEIALKAFQGTFSKFPTAVPDTQARAYLYVSARNLCINFLVARRRTAARYTQWVQENDFLEYEREIEIPVIDAISRIIDSQLPESCRRVFTSVYFDGLSIKETALIFGITESTVSVQLHRGLVKIRKELGK